MEKVRILENVFENGIPVHTQGEIKELGGTELPFLKNRGWARNLTSDEVKELEAAQEKATAKTDQAAAGAQEEEAGDEGAGDEGGDVVDDSGKRSKKKK